VRGAGTSALGHGWANATCSRVDYTMQLDTSKLSNYLIQYFECKVMKHVRNSTEFVHGASKFDVTLLS